MPFHDSELGPGTLLLGTTPGTEYGFQVSAISLVPSVDSADGVPTLADPAPPPTTTTTYALEGSAINDFTSQSGLQRYCYENDGVETDFVWTPNDSETTPATLTGKVTVRAFQMGGDVASPNQTQDFSWPCTGKPVWAGGPTAAAADEEKAAKK